MSKKLPIVFGTLVRNTVINKSGYVIDTYGKTATVKYANGTVEIVEKKNLEVNIPS